MTRVHVVGAGLAGLAAAAALAQAGRRVALYESAEHAGGRCRSYFDSELGARLDNGNHLLLSGNRSALAYLKMIGGLETFEPPKEAAIPFIDLTTGERWVLRPNRGVVPWWIGRSNRRVPGSRAGDYLAALRLRNAGPDATIAERLDSSALLFRKLWQPVAVAALNTAAEEGSAWLLWRVLRETLGRGAAACRPMVPREGLSESLINPALAMLRAGGAEIRFGCRLRAFDMVADRVGKLVFDGETIGIDEGDDVVLAVPAAIAARLVPGLVVPDDHAPIVNAHFRFAPPEAMPLFAGLIGGSAEWVFRKRGVISVTVSAADRLVDLPSGELSDLLWRDVAAAMRLPADSPPPSRIVKERRATFRATPAQLRRRPPTLTRWNNLLLAGDYVDTGLPATIEGAIRSGFAAAEAIMKRRGAHHLTQLESDEGAEHSDGGGPDAGRKAPAVSRARHRGDARDKVAAVAAA